MPAPASSAIRRCSLELGSTFQATTLPGRADLHDRRLRHLDHRLRGGLGDPRGGDGPAGARGHGTAPGGDALPVLKRQHHRRRSAPTSTRSPRSSRPPRSRTRPTGSSSRARTTAPARIMGPFVIAFALIGLIMAMLIVFNVVSGAVVAQYHRIGVLKSLGMTPGQVIAVYLNRIGWPALAGCVVGVILGDLLSVPIMGKLGGRLRRRPPVGPAVGAARRAAGHARADDAVRVRPRAARRAGCRRPRRSPPGAPRSPAAATWRTGCCRGCTCRARSPSGWPRRSPGPAGPW